MDNSAIRLGVLIRSARHLKPHGSGSQLHPYVKLTCEGFKHKTKTLLDVRHLKG